MHIKPRPEGPIIPEERETAITAERPGPPDAPRKLAGQSSRSRSPPPSSGSGLDGRQIEPTEPFWIRQNVHLDDLSAHDCESDHGEQTPIRKARHDADVAIYQDHLTGQRNLRER